jgi:hypothetical protein
MYKGIINVKPQSDYKLLLTFDNDEIREFDVKPYLNHGIFSELSDVSIFNSVHVSFDAIEWKNGADLDPETLYDESIPATTQFIA